MTLLQALHKLSSRHRWRLTVAHFNHQLRGRSSNADEELVRQTAAAMRLPFVAGRANVKAFAQKSKMSIEMAARKLRHDFFARTAKERKTRVIALAHHADDQVELFFLRVLRGAGGEGLAGMKWRSPSPVDSKIMLVRPLLDATKAELRGFARENKIPFREDATNARLEMPRNRVRNELLPLLQRRYQPALTKTVLRLMEIVGAESELIGEMAQQWLRSRTKMNALSPLKPKVRAGSRRLLQKTLTACPLRFNGALCNYNWPGLACRWILIWSNSFAGRRENLSASARICRSRVMRTENLIAGNTCRKSSTLMN